MSVSAYTLCMRLMRLFTVFYSYIVVQFLLQNNYSKTENILNI